MANSKTTTKSDVMFYVRIIGGLLLLTILYGGSAAIYGRTLIDWLTPLTVALSLALVSWALLRGCWVKLWKNTNVYLLLLGHLVFMTGLGLFMFLGANYFFTDKSTLHSEEVTVESRLRQKRHHTKRVGTRRYVQGEPYYEYYLRVEFANGRRKDIHVSVQRYSRTRTGSVITLELEKGLLGYPVIRTKL